MPNWCMNHVACRHNDPAKMEALKSALKDDVFFDHIIPIVWDDRNVEETKDNWLYEQACNLWSTKWEASGISWMRFTNEDKLSINFESAWCPPEGVYQAMFNQGWEIEAYYYEPGMGFVGKFFVKDGVLVDESYEIHDDPIPAELVEMFGIGEVYEDTEYELVDNGDGHYIVKERIDDEQTEVEG